MAFADLPTNGTGPSRQFLGPHIFDRVCIEHGIEHRLTKPNHPWTDGQAERMNRAIKDATVKRFHCDDLASLMAHGLAFVSACNFAKPLKAPRWNTPFQTICRAWNNNADRFKINPCHLIPGPYTYCYRAIFMTAGCVCNPRVKVRYDFASLETSSPQLQNPQ